MNHSVTECRTGENMDKVILQNTINRFDAKRPSHLLTHPSGRCCSRVHSWFKAMAYSYGIMNLGLPYWLHDQWEWGPSKWPMYWCEILKNKTIDCGVFAELAEVALKETGQKTMRVQSIEEYSSDVCQNWEHLWSSADCCGDWINGIFVYHEMVGLVHEDLKIWDPVDNHFITFSKRANKQQGRMVAIRLIPSDTFPPEKVGLWGLQLKEGVWHNLKSSYI